MSSTIAPRHRASRAMWLASILLLTRLVHAAAPVPAPPTIDARSYILMDYHSGQTLAGEQADLRLAPASITKLMTGLIAFRELEAGHIKPDELVTVSEKAWRTPGSRMFIEVGKQVSVEDLLRGMIVQSGNDASVALAELIAGSEETFAAMMNEVAAELGMSDTHFTNSTGLPDEAHYSTARDLAILSRAVIGSSPAHYALYAEKEFTYNDITQHNRNSLLWQEPGVDGLKTGHTDAAGYCLAASAARDGMRLVSVVMGSRSEKSRTQASRALLSYGFRFFETHELYASGAEVTTISVWKGAQPSARLGLGEALMVTIPRGQYARLEASMERTPKIIAPVASGMPLGTVRVTFEGETVAERPLLALEDVGRGSLWRRAIDEVRLWFD